MKFKVGDVVRLNKRCKPHHLGQAKVKVGDCGVVTSLDIYIKDDGTSILDPHIRFFSGEQYWVQSYFISKVKVKKDV